jgi:carbon-monoxide dehydrogenase medium subunit
MIPAEFTYHVPRSVKEAVDLLAATPDAKVLGGGMSLIPAMKHRLMTPPALVDLQRIADLARIETRADAVAIGGYVTHAAVAKALASVAAAAVVCETAEAIGDVQVRNRGTIGGSLVHADPAADWPATFLALDGEATVVGPGGTRKIRAGDFFTGMLATAVQADEILIQVRLPLAGKGTAYVKVRQPASGFAVVGVAVSLALDKQGRCERLAVGVTGVNTSAFRATSVEQKLTGKALVDAEVRAACGTIDECDPSGDLYASADYRRHLLSVYARRAILKALQRAKQ